MNRHWELIGTVILSFSLFCSSSSAANFSVKGDFEKVTIKEKVNGCSIDAEYPRFRAGKIPADAVAGLNGEVRLFVRKDIKNAVGDGTAGNAFLKHDRKDDKGLGSFESITFKVVRVDARYVSIKFERYHYGEGAAHGLNIISTFNYDIARKKIIGLDDLFEPKSAYLEELSMLCGKDLIKQVGKVDEGWIKDGIAPNKVNFAAFGLQEKALVLYFQPYQVACYASGEPEVHISFNMLTTLKKELIGKKR